MRNLDEILADAKAKDMNRLQPHTHETRTAVETVAEVPQPKAAPSVKERKSRKISTRGLLLLLVLGIAGVGTVFGLASTGPFTPNSNKIPTPISQTCGAPYTGDTGAGKEIITKENAVFTNNTEVILDLCNTGNVAITLSSYYVKDSVGDSYSMTSFNGPAITPNALGQTQIDIGTASGATNGGQPFVFTSGNSYTVLVVTSRNNQFSFTVTP